MKRLAAVVVLSLAGAALVLTSAQGSPTAKKTASIPVPRDGNATVAHLVLQAAPRKGTKPKKPAKRPRLKVQTAPKGAVVAASYKRDAKNKNRWHATVVITNPVSAPLRSTASSVGGSQDEGKVVLIIETDDGYIIVFGQVEIEEEVAYQEMSVPPWMRTYCDPPGSSGDAFLFGPPPAGVPATEFLDYGCVLGSDGPADFDAYRELGLAGVVLDLDPFPGNPVEYYAEFAGFNIAPYNGIAITAPPGHTVTALLPPAGGFDATKSGTTATFGRQDMPFTPGTVYRANIRYDNAFTPQDVLTARFSTDFGETYSPPFPGHFTP